MVKFVHKERVAEGSTRRFLDGRRNDVAPRKNLVAKFRESHHIVAKLFAAGLRGNEVAAKTGYAEQYTALLHNDPAFQELLSKYRDLDTQLFLEGRDEFYSLATKNMIQAERQLSDKMDELDEEGEFLPTRELISVVADRADRFGYGKRETKFNVNVDFADALQRAIKRSGKTIEGQVSEGLGGMKLEAGSTRDIKEREAFTLAQSPATTLLTPSEVVPSVPQAGPVPSSASGDHLGSAEGTPSFGRSVEAPQREMVRPGAVESRPLRRRLLG